MASTVDSDCEKEDAHLDFQGVLTLEDYCNDVMIVNPKDRNAYLIGVAMTIPELGVSMDLFKKNVVLWKIPQAFEKTATKRTKAERWKDERLS